MSLSECECGDNIDLDEMDLKFDSEFNLVYWTVICLRCEAMDHFVADVTNERYVR